MSYCRNNSQTDKEVILLYHSYLVIDMFASIRINKQLNCIGMYVIMFCKYI